MDRVETELDIKYFGLEYGAVYFLVELDVSLVNRQLGITVIVIVYFPANQG